MKPGSIPFLDLITMHEELKPELVSVFQNALRTASFIGGPLVEDFEHEFAQFCNAKHCAGVASGTDAVRFALMAAGVQAGEIVLTVPHTFIATTEAITQAGARTEFVDINEKSYSMDPAKLSEYLHKECVADQKTGRPIHRKHEVPVAAVVPVHIYGQTADMDPIFELAERFRLSVIEDACQAHGAEYFSRRENKWQKAGSIGHAAAFSFYPGKNLGACGEAGAVTTNDDEISRKIKMLRDHGQAKKYYHKVEGYNGRLDSIQAGFLSVKLRHLARWNDQRRVSAQIYNELLAPMGEIVGIPHEPSWSKSVYHLYVIRTKNREELQKHLSDAGIGSGIHYPIPVHLQDAYSTNGWKRGDFPIAERAAAEVLSLPMFAGLEFRDQQRITESIAEFASIRSIT